MEKDANMLFIGEYFPRCTYLSIFNDIYLNFHKEFNVHMITDSLCFLNKENTIIDSVVLENYKKLYSYSSVDPYYSNSLNTQVIGLLNLINHQLFKKKFNYIFLSDISKYGYLIEFIKHFNIKIKLGIFSRKSLELMFDSEFLISYKKNIHNIEIVTFKPYALELKERCILDNLNINNVPLLFYKNRYTYSLLKKYTICIGQFDRSELEELKKKNSNYFSKIFYYNSFKSFYEDRKGVLKIEELILCIEEQEIRGNKLEYEILKTIVLLNMGLNVLVNKLNLKYYIDKKIIYGEEYGEFIELCPNPENERLK